MTTDVLGTPVKRVEDPRFITGKGRYLDDIQLQGMVHIAILRSPYAHANIASIDTSRAKKAPGVLAVIVGADIPYNPLPMAWPAGGASGLQNNVNVPRTLATDSVKWTGEGVAAVVAETPAQAQDALELIDVEYVPLPAVVDAEKATQPGAPQLHENAPNNVVFVWPVGDKDGTDAAFENAEVVVKQRLVNNRLIPNPMEVRGDIGWYNPGTEEYTIWMSSQTPHIQRLLLTAFVTGVPEHKVRCISPDVGGAFGTKIFCYADMALVMFASKLVGGLPVKWVEGRRESYGSTIHGRDHITYVEAAANRNGEVQGLRVKTFANLGGRLSTIGPGIPTTLYGRVLAGPYKIPNVYAEVTGVYTNTTFVDAYRGAGRPEATYVVERTMDLLADELGIDPAEIRRRNFLPPDAFPYDNPSGLLTAVNGSKLFIDSGNYEPAMDKALAMAGYADMATRKAEAKARGKLLGVGLSTYIEVCGVAPASGSAPSARAGAPRCGRAPTSGSTSPARPSSRWAPSRRARATRPPTRRSSATSWASRWTTSSSSIRTPRARRSATGRTAAAPRTSARAPRSRPPARSARRRAATPRTCSKPAPTTSRSRATSTGSRARPRR